MPGHGNDLTKLEGLVLRKTTYAEASLILALLTREAGQQHVILKGALRSGKKSFPEADLFRLVEVVYKESSRSDLHTARSVEALHNYDAIARQPTTFRLASWINRFALQNTIGNEPAPLLFEAMRVAYGRLAGGLDTANEAIALGICFVALGEQGLLPDVGGQAHLERGVRQMQQFALHEQERPPDYPPETWRNLRRWMLAHLHRVDLQVPDGWDTLGA